MKHFTRAAGAALLAVLAGPACRPESRFDPNVYRDPQRRFEFRLDGKFSVVEMDPETLYVSQEGGEGLTVRVVVDDQTKWVKRGGKWPAAEADQPPVSFETFASDQLVNECRAGSDACATSCAQKGRRVLTTDAGLSAVEVRLSETTEGAGCGDAARPTRDLAYAAAVDVSDGGKSIVLYFRPIVPGYEPEIFLEASAARPQDIDALRQLVASVKVP